MQHIFKITISQNFPTTVSSNEVAKKRFLCIFLIQKSIDKCQVLLTFMNPLSTVFWNLENLLKLEIYPQNISKKFKWKVSQYLLFNGILYKIAWENIFSYFENSWRTKFFLCLSFKCFQKLFYCYTKHHLEAVLLLLLTQATVEQREKICKNLTSH